MRFTLPLLFLPLAVSAPLAASEVVALPGFNNIDLRGGGEIVIVPGPTQRVTLLDGSPAITRFHVDRTGKLQIDACNNHCPQRYRLRLEIQSPTVPAVGIHGGGSIRATAGFAPQSQVAAGIAGGGRIDLRAVPATAAAAGINGGGLILVQARSTLAAGVNGGGEVRYVGNPQVTMAVNGGGSVRRD